MSPGSRMRRMGIDADVDAGRERRRGRPLERRAQRRHVRHELFVAPQHTGDPLVP